MKFLTLNTISALSLATLLAACGGYQADEPAQGAAPAPTRIATTGVSTVPAPDCAADGCRGLRIIDANAEAYRYDAMRRAAEAPQS